METVLAAVIIVFLILFAGMTISEVFLTTQDDISAAWQEMQARLDDQVHTRLALVDVYAVEAGAVFVLVLGNDGAEKLADFDAWDVFVQYYDDAGDYYITRLAYADGALPANAWTVSGIFSRAEDETAEVFEPGLFNPGEEIVLDMAITPAAAPGSSVQMVLAAANGSGAATVFITNLPPVLANNLGLTLPVAESAAITSDVLLTTDADGTADDLLYTVTLPPTQGALSLPVTFSQAEIEAGQLTYTHTGSSNDGFQFTVTDGYDVIGDYTFTITVSEPPLLMTSLGLTVSPGGMGTIDAAVLEVTDTDNLPAELTYTIIEAPTQGTLSLGSTFSQADVNDGALTYTHTGSGPDAFTYTVTDGVSLIGPHTFTITVP